MKTLALALLVLLSFSTISKAQSSDTELVERAGLNYLEGFYEGDTLKIKESISPDLYKYGYWKSNTGTYGGEQMTFREAVDYSKSVFEKKRFARDTAPKEVVILDLQEHIACVKITAWWGVDYALLSKKDEVWKIEQVLWQGPYTTLK